MLRQCAAAVSFQVTPEHGPADCFYSGAAGPSRGRYATSRCRGRAPGFAGLNQMFTPLQAARLTFSRSFASAPALHSHLAEMLASAQGWCQLGGGREVLPCHLSARLAVLQALRLPGSLAWLRVGCREHAVLAGRRAPAGGRAHAVAAERPPGWRLPSAEAAACGQPRLAPGTLLPRSASGWRRHPGRTLAVPPRAWCARPTRHAWHRADSFRRSCPTWRGVLQRVAMPPTGRQRHVHWCGAGGLHWGPACLGRAV